MPVVANILQPLNDVEEWVLESLHGIGLTWGLAIVGLTLMTRMLTLPLVVRQFRSQREMKLHMPELKRMKERYKGDKQNLQQEMSAYYREHGINPLASVGPLLLQVPIFISLYMLLRQDATNGLFGDTGFLFIPDLTAKPEGAVLIAMLLVYVCSQLASSAIATRTMQSSHRGLAMGLPILFADGDRPLPGGPGDLLDHDEPLEPRAADHVLAALPGGAVGNRGARRRGRGRHRRRRGLEARGGAGGRGRSRARGAGAPGALAVEEEEAQPQPAPDPHRVASRR